MKKLLFVLLILLGFYQTADAQITKKLGGLAQKADNVLKGGNPLSEEEVGNGLKAALDLGVGEAVSFLSAENGYFASPYKILIPEEARTVTSKLKAVPGFENVEANLEEKINRAAELAAAKAKPIFVNAIKGLTIRDAMNILMGEKDAATRYLESNTRNALLAEFLPVIQQSLDEVNAREYWRSAVTAYNKIPLVKKTDPELDRYVTDKALLGMFSLVEVKEVELREKPAMRNTELLRKVFAQQDK